METPDKSPAMETITLSCPACGYARQTERDSIPGNCLRVRCPKCREGFPLPDREETPGPVAPRKERIGFAFTGKAREYFGIWIVNTLLKIVTLGIYSPWAKVRKRAYFYGNTSLDSAPFEYLANPLALLKGWLVAAALFIAYSVGSSWSPLLGSVLGFLFYMAVPVLIVRSRIFNGRYSSHRNIRFSFKADYRGAYTAFAWLPILSPLTLGLLFPYALYRQRRFLAENGLFGKTPFEFDGEVKAFYLVFLKAAGLAILVGALFPLSALLSGNGALALGAPFVPFLIPASLTLGFFILALYIQTSISNLAWNATTIAGHRFNSSLRTRDLAWIYLSNAVAILLSFGLLIPWASIRLARYRFDKLAFETQGDLSTFLADNFDEVGATGEEIGDLFDMEVGF